MKVAFALLANYAEVAPDGKLSVVGGDIHELSGTFPYPAPPMVLIAKVVFSQEECLQEHHFSADILRPDGVVSVLVEGNVTPPAPVKPGRTKTGMALLIRMQGVVFPVPGKYEIRLTLGGTLAESVTLFLDPVLPQQPQET